MDILQRHKRESNDRGNFKTITPRPERSRFYYDVHVCTEEQGWVTYETIHDCWEFGVWVRESTREILIFADGEVVVISCPTREHLQNEIIAMSAVYGPPPGSFSRFFDMTNIPVRGEHVLS